MTNTLRIMRALALALAAATAVLSACAGSSGEPQTAPPVSTSPASASSPSPAAGQVPVEARAATSTGAEAFARFFYVEVKRAFDTKNPDLVAAISAPGCQGCGRYVASIKRLRDRNERMENLAFNVVLAVAPAVTGETARVDVAWSSPLEVVRYDAQGQVLHREGPFRRVDDQVTLVRSNDGWLIREVESLRFEK